MSIFLYILNIHSNLGFIDGKWIPEFSVSQVDAASHLQVATVGNKQICEVFTSTCHWFPGEVPSTGNRITVTNEERVLLI
jgi:hypothetical protein